MALPRDCPGCALGNHDDHDANHGVIPGLIGGTVCHCAGDCAERHANDAKLMFGDLDSLPAFDPTAPLS